MAESKAKDQPRTAVTFPSKLGWMAITGRGDALERLTFGHASPEAALAALGDDLQTASIGRWNASLVKRLQAFAAGAPDDFRDVKIHAPGETDFQRRVRAACRLVGYGQTSSYAGLAAAAGSPRAARAVGNIMRSNPVALVIPCHRILASGGKLGGYSAVDGLLTKSRLLAMEAAGARIQDRKGQPKAPRKKSRKSRPGNGRRNRQQ